MPRQEKPYDWLLQKERRRPSAITDRTLEEEADSDRGRVLFCAPFRRLQNKAQVFSLETNAAVRSRLTHSFEVSSIGRYIAQQAVKAVQRTDKKDELGLNDKEKERAFITFVETACLLHDIGNPPFGHFGEIAISDWFQTKRGDIIDLKPLGADKIGDWEKNYQDFQHFDGNPQGFRVVTRLQPNYENDLNGLNLTATTLAALIKYPVGSTELAGREQTGKRQKAGFFQSEYEVVGWIRRVLRLSTGMRHPLVYLMEAADDIAYCISDIEDGLEKGLLESDRFCAALKLALKTILKDPAYADIKEALNRFDDQGSRKSGEKRSLTPMPDLRAAVIRVMVKGVSIAFAQQQQQILFGPQNGVSLFDRNERAILDAIKSFATDHLYNSQIVRQREITGYKVISGILDAYFPVLACPYSRFLAICKNRLCDDAGRNITVESSLVNRIGGKQMKVYCAAMGGEMPQTVNNPEHELKERIHRIHLVIDYLSGMTDEFAMQTFQLISGITLR
jgi:dGTPase